MDSLWSCCWVPGGDCWSDVHVTSKHKRHHQRKKMAISILNFNFRYPHIMYSMDGLRGWIMHGVVHRKSVACARLTRTETKIAR